MGDPFSGVTVGGAVGGRAEVKAEPAYEVKPRKLTKTQRAVADFILDFLKNNKKVKSYDYLDRKLKKSIMESDMPGAEILRQILRANILISTGMGDSHIKSYRQCSDYGGKLRASRDVINFIGDKIYYLQCQGKDNEFVAEEITKNLSEAIVAEKKDLIKLGKGKTASAHDRLEKERTGRGKLFKPGAEKKGDIVVIGDHEFSKLSPKQREAVEKINAGRMHIIKETEGEVLEAVKAVRGDAKFRKAPIESKGEIAKSILGSYLKGYPEIFIKNLADLIQVHCNKYGAEWLEKGSFVLEMRRILTPEGKTGNGPEAARKTGEPARRTMHETKEKQGLPTGAVTATEAAHMNDKAAKDPNVRAEKNGEAARREGRANARIEGGRKR